jgi:hypothetical protein
METTILESLVRIKDGLEQSHREAQAHVHESRALHSVPASPDMTVRYASGFGALAGAIQSKAEWLEDVIRRAALDDPECLGLCENCGRPAHPVLSEEAFRDPFNRVWCSRGCCFELDPGTHGILDDSRSICELLRVES